MKMWSRGLGRKELTMDCRYYQIKKDPESENVFIIGKITEPVNWEFKITIEPEDIPGLMKLFFNFSVILLTLKNAFRYLLYLLNKKQYAVAHDLEEKVELSYQQMMQRSRPVRTRIQQRSLLADEIDTMEVQDGRL